MLDRRRHPATAPKTAAMSTVLSIDVLESSEFVEPIAGLLIFPLPLLLPYPLLFPLSFPFPALFPLLFPLLFPFPTLFPLLFPLLFPFPLGWVEEVEPTTYQTKLEDKKECRYEQAART